MEGIGPTDHVPKRLSTLSQFLLCRQQNLDNPGPGPWIVADWKALRTNAGNRCACFLLSLFAEAVLPNSIGEAEFYGFVDCFSPVSNTFEMGPSCYLTLKKTSLE